jgi:phage-related protein
MGSPRPSRDRRTGSSSVTQVPPHEGPTPGLTEYDASVILLMVEEKRELRWAAGCRRTLRAFPEGTRWRFGRALRKLQSGGRPAISSPLKGELAGVAELSDDRHGEAHRLYFTLKCSDAVYALYCHKKKSKRGIGIPKHERELLVRRLKEALADCEMRREESP